jgi:hypothetical protein
MKTDGLFINTKYYECLGTDPIARVSPFDLRIAPAYVFPGPARASACRSEFAVIGTFVGAGCSKLSEYFPDQEGRKTFDIAHSDLVRGTHKSLHS